MSEHRPVRRRALAAACGALAAVAGTAEAAQAADPGVTCRSSAVRVQLLGGTPIEPLAANDGRARCATGASGLVNLGGSGLPIGLTADAAFAETTATQAAAPAARRADARAGAAVVTLPGALAGLRIEGVTSTATAACANGVAQLTGDSTVARIALGPAELPVDQVVERLGDGLNGLPAGALLRIVPGEEVRSGSAPDGTLTRRALHVSLALGGNTLVDAVVGEATAGTADAACTATGGGAGSGDGTGGGNGSGGGTGADTLGRPIAGSPYGGGMAVTLGQLGVLGISATHPCRNRRYGGDVAIVGTNGRDALVGSRFDDRIFGLRAGDRATGSGRRDCIDGGGGNDRASGAGGKDLVLGAGGRDQLRGGASNDRLKGGAGRDVLKGDAGADRLLGNAGADRIVTGKGKDRAWGGPGNDTIDARAKGGRQRVDCGTGRDTVRLNKGDVARRCERVIRRR